MSGSIHYQANSNAIQQALLSDSSYQGTTRLTQSLHDDLAGLAGTHQEQELTALLWRTIQEDLFEFLQIEPESGVARTPIHNRNILLNLINKAIDIESDNRIRVCGLGHKEVRFSEPEEPPRTGPTRRWSSPPPAIQDPHRLPPDPQKRREEREHFLGGGNPRRPSKN